MSIQKSSRRKFLKSASAALAAPMIVPASVLGRTGTAPSNKVNIGLFGTGDRGKTHAGMFPYFSKQMHLAAIADMNRNHLENIRKIITGLFDTLPYMRPRNGY